jgi:PAS domain S-box-containing protein
MSEARPVGANDAAGPAGLAARLREAEAARERLELDRSSVLDALADGVLTVGPEGEVTSLNPAGAVMLGLSREEAVGASLRELLIEEEGADDFLDAVLAPLSGESGGRRVVDYRRGDGAAKRLSVSSTAFRPRLGPQAGRVGVTVAFTDVTEMERLAAAEAEMASRLAAQHAQLQDAFRRLERQAEEVRGSARRIQLIRLGATAGAVVLFLGLIGWAVLPLLPFSAPAPAAAAAGAATIVATPRPIGSRIAVVGSIEPGAQVNVVAPFDGNVRERMFRYGGAVTRGEPLLRLDTAEVEKALREARAAEIRARQRVLELRGWANGVEVSRARRGVAAAELEVADLRARLGQARMLLGRGIIAAEEARGLEQRLRSQEIQLAAARQDLEAALARGDAETVRVAELELAGAEARLRELETDLSSAVVHAPVSGVVLLPPQQEGGGPAGGGRRGEMVEVGTRLSRGQAAVTIGDLEFFRIRAAVDEIDLARVRPGLPVRVTGDGFEGITLSGRVVAVAGQASQEGGFGRPGLPTFPVTVEVMDLTPEQRARLAVGMSANLSIVVYENPAAIILPPSAIRLEDGAPAVRLRDGGRIRTVPVTLGITTPDGVEVRTGLSPGDVVAME